MYFIFWKVQIICFQKSTTKDFGFCEGDFEVDFKSICLPVNVDFTEGSMIFLVEKKPSKIEYKISFEEYLIKGCDQVAISITPLHQIIFFMI